MGSDTRFQGFLWLTAQAALALLLARPWAAFDFDPIRTGFALILCLLGALLMAWTQRHNRPGNWQVAPDPRTGSRLIETGPYNWVRHPMYVAVLCVAAGLALVRWDTVAGASWILLWALFRFKAGIEERSLKARYATYSDYCLRTGAFLPSPSRLLRRSR